MPVGSEATRLPALYGEPGTMHPTVTWHFKNGLPPMDLVVREVCVRYEGEIPVERYDYRWYGIDVHTAKLQFSEGEVGFQDSAPKNDIRCSFCTGDQAVFQAIDKAMESLGGTREKLESPSES
jgi:hypothetical protein